MRPVDLMLLATERLNILKVILVPSRQADIHFSFFGLGSGRSYKVGVVGNNWLVIIGNAVFSETALRIFLIFCMKLGDYIKVEK